MKFEYKTMLLDATPMWSSKKYNPETVDPFLGVLGEAGWELVSTSPITVSNTDMTILFTFKRPAG